MLSYIDTNFIVKAYSNNPDSDRCRERLNRGNLATSPVAIIEAWQALMHVLGVELANRAIIDLLRRDVEIIKMDASLIHDSVKGQPRFGLDAFDTAHVIAAKMSGCGELLTFDNDFLRIKTEPPARRP